MTTGRGTLIGIARRGRPRAPMDIIETVAISREAGLEGDFRGTMMDRQVTVLFREGWEAACATLGETLPWVTRRANLFVDGLTVPQRGGARLRIGAVVLEVSEECAPCSVMEKQASGLRAALHPDWRGGIACRVIEGGAVSMGDPVILLPE